MLIVSVGVNRTLLQPFSGRLSIYFCLLAEAFASLDVSYVAVTTLARCRRPVKGAPLDELCAPPLRHRLRHGRLSRCRQLMRGPPLTRILARPLRYG